MPKEDPACPQGLAHEIIGELVGLSVVGRQLSVLAEATREGQCDAHEPKTCARIRRNLLVICAPDNRQIGLHPLGSYNNSSL